MNRKILVFIALAVPVLSGCGGNSAARITETPDVTIGPVTEADDTSANTATEDFVPPANVTVSAEYDSTAAGAPLKQIVDDWLDESYENMTIAEHTIYQSSIEGCDLEDWITVNIICDNPSGMMDQKITKTLVYSHNTQSDLWELNPAKLKKWVVNDNAPVKLGLTYWTGHLDKATDVNEKLFIDADGNKYIDELSESAGADMYVYFKGDFSFFTVKVNPNATDTKETIFYTEGTAVLNCVSEGNVYQREIHFVEGKLDDHGHIYFMPEDTNEYFELLPMMTLITKEEYEAATS